MEEELCSFTEFDVPGPEDWKKLAIEALKGAPYEKKLVFQTDEGIDVQPIYSLDDYLKNDVAEQFPGVSAFERGVEPTGYLKQVWRFAQPVRLSDPAEANRRIHEQIKGGQNCVHLEIDRATRRWEDPEGTRRDSAEPTEGLNLFCREDLATVLADVPIDRLPLHLYAGENPATALGLLASAFFKNGERSKIHGIVAGDPFSEWACNGLSLGSVSWQLDTLPALIRWVKKHELDIKTILIRGDYYQDSGAHSALEVAIVLGLYTEYLRELLTRGVSKADAAFSIALSIGIGPNFFMEISKIRALRVLLHQVQEAFEVPGHVQGAFIHAKVARWDKTLYDSYVNLLRNTSQAFSAVSAGVDSLEIPAYDALFNSSNAFSERVSRNLHHILEKESRLTYPIDPAAGSWYVESLTESFCKKAWAIFQEIESLGGILKALQGGWVHKAIDASREKRDKPVRTRKRPFIGTTLFANRQEKSSDFFRQGDTADPLERYRQHMKTRTHFSLPKEVGKSFLKGDVAAMEAIVSFFREGGTIGTLKRLLTPGSDPTPIELLKPYRSTEAFEGIRERTERWEARRGARFPLYLLLYGSLTQYKARADFSEGFFEVAGFQSERTPGVRTLDEASKAIEELPALPEGDAGIFVICSSDELYPEIVPPLASRLKARFPNGRVVLAGKPASGQEQAYKDGGVDRWIYMGCDLVDFLTTIQNEVMPDA